MGPRRGPVLAYSRGGTISTSRQTLSNYKNKIFIALGATILYTAFLYRSGTFDSPCHVVVRLPRVSFRSQRRPFSTNAAGQEELAPSSVA